MVSNRVRFPMQFPPKHTNMKQTRKLEGSFINYLMGNNSTRPVPGKGATLLYHSDRHPAEVLEVSQDGTRCVIREMGYKARANAGGMGHQEWDIFPNPDAPTETLVYRNGAWRKVCKIVLFVNDWWESFSSPQERISAQKELNLWDEHGRLRYVKGVTRISTTYPVVKILFGQAEYHYDWEF